MGNRVLTTGSATSVKGPAEAGRYDTRTLRHEVRRKPDATSGSPAEAGARYGQVRRNELAALGFATAAVDELPEPELQHHEGPQTVAMLAPAGFMFVPELSHAAVAKQTATRQS